MSDYKVVFFLSTFPSGYCIRQIMKIWSQPNLNTIFRYYLDSGRQPKLNSFGEKIFNLKLQPVSRHHTLTKLNFHIIHINAEIFSSENVGIFEKSTDLMAKPALATRNQTNYERDLLQLGTMLYYFNSIEYPGISANGYGSRWKMVAWCWFRIWFI